jgi:hypothetical protein
MRYLLASVMFLTLLVLGCSSGSSSPATPSETDDIQSTLNRAADALESGNVDECLKYFHNPDKFGDTLRSMRKQFPMLAKAIRNAIVEESDSDQIRLIIRTQRPDNPRAFIESRMFLLKSHDDKWLISAVPIRHKKRDERNAEWCANSTHGSYLTRAIIEYYIRNYPNDWEFTGANGLLNQKNHLYQTTGTHPGVIDTVLGLYDVDIYNNVPPEALIVGNVPSALLQIGSIDEDVFVGEYDSGMNLTFNRDIQLDTSSGLKFTTSNSFGEDDDTFFKGSAHFLTPLNQDYYQESFIGFNDIGFLGDISGSSAPTYKWGLGMENIGPINIIDIVDMRRNWNRKTWQYAIRQFEDAQTEPDILIKAKKLADSFYALGHIMHLLEDSGIPAHVRNDMHGVPALHYIPGFDFLQPDPLEDWAGTFEGSFINRTFELWQELYFDFDPIRRYPGGFSTHEPLLHYYYNNAEIPEHAGYEAIFKSLAFMTNRTFFSEDTIHRSTQSYADTTTFPRITDWEFDYGGRTVLYGRAGLPFYNEEHPLAVSTFWFDTWCTGFYALHWRWPTLQEVIDELEGDDDLFTIWDEWDEDFFTDGRKGICETEWEVQFKRCARHGAAMLHEFYLETHK